MADLTGSSALTASTTATYAFMQAGTVRLKPSTIYWVVAEGGSVDVDWTTTASDAEDANSVSNLSPGPVAHLKIGNDSESRIESSIATVMKVKSKDRRPLESGRATVSDA